MSKVDFLFDVKDVITTPFDQKGIIEMCAIDGSKKKVYFVKTQINSEWYDEDELKK